MLPDAHICSMTLCYGCEPVDNQTFLSHGCQAGAFASLLTPIISDWHATTRDCLRFLYPNEFSSILISMSCVAWRDIYDWTSPMMILVENWLRSNHRTLLCTQNSIDSAVKPAIDDSQKRALCDSINVQARPVNFVCQNWVSHEIARHWNILSLKPDRHFFPCRVQLDYFVPQRVRLSIPFTYSLRAHNCFGKRSSTSDDYPRMRMIESQALDREKPSFW